MGKIKGFQKIERDINLVELDKDNLLVIACDSAGGIGPKKHDRIKVPAELIGAFTARVALMEVISVAAEPLSIVDALAVEYNPTGEEILNGIKGELKRIGLDSQIAVNGSTEENIETSQTGIGVTVLGRVNRDKIKIAAGQPGDILIAVGLPMVGEEVLANQEKVADLPVLQQLLGFKGVHEIIPVGSKGLAYEAGILARSVRLRLKLRDDSELDLQKSAGPATSLLTAVEKDLFAPLKAEIAKPLIIIGELAEF
ncbi:MAG: hypothetical protein FH762_16700 [Firmicutes bacterium]|nr:hypothetical protein [Bacillota bacterium]